MDSAHGCRSLECHDDAGFGLMKADGCVGATAPNQIPWVAVLNRRFALAAVRRGGLLGDPCAADALDRKPHHTKHR